MEVVVGGDGLARCWWGGSSADYVAYHDEEWGYGVTSDDKWNARFNPQGRTHQTGWGVVFGLVLSLLVGSTVLMSTIAFSGQRYFEYQIEEGRKISQ
jgi:hypothetical protein